MKREHLYKANDKRNNRAILTVLVGVVCLSLFIVNGFPKQVVGADATPAKALKIGVVDLNDVFSKFEKRKKCDAQLKELEAQYQKSINDKKKELVALNEKIQLMDLGSEARKKDEEAFEKKNMELESFAKFAEKNLVKKYKSYFEGLYTEVCKEVEDIGKREQYDLIIKKEEPELQGGGISELQFKVGIKTVLYNSDAMELTNRVIDSLNKKYAEVSKGK